MGKFWLLMVFFVAILLVNAVFVTRAPGDIDRYDALVNDIALLEIDVVKFEYLLDIYVVAGSFESGRSELLDRDAGLISAAIKRMEASESVAVFANPEARALRDAISAKWDLVLNELKSMRSAKGSEALLLIHNYVDQHTYEVSEQLKKLSVIVQGSRKAVLQSKADMDFAVHLFSLIFFAAAALYYGIRVMAPQREFLRIVRGVREAGGANLIAREDMGGEYADLCRDLIRMKAEHDEFEKAAKTRLSDAEGALASELGRTELVRAMAEASSSTLSYHDVFLTTLANALGVLGSSGAAVYVNDGHRLKLLVSKGFSGSFFYKGEFASVVVGKGGKEAASLPHVFNVAAEYPSGDFKGVLMEEGVAMLVTAPMRAAGEITGELMLAFRETRQLNERETAFVAALAQLFSAIYAHAAIFSREYSAKMFYENMLESMSFGIAAFDKTGKCVIANSVFKKYLLGHASGEFAGNYNVLEDELLMRQGLVEYVKKAYGGVAAEFIYDNTLSPGIGKRPEKMRATVSPVFTPGGSVEHVVLKYDAMSPEDRGVKS